MSDNKSTQITPVCSIEFYYDPLTEVPKYRIRRADGTFMDPLSVYAMACVEVLDEQHPDIIRRVEQLAGDSRVSLKVH